MKKNGHDKRKSDWYAISPGRKCPDCRGTGYGVDEHGRQDGSCPKCQGLGKVSR